jgi:hypothetical protein
MWAPFAQRNAQKAPTLPVTPPVSWALGSRKGKAMKLSIFLFLALFSAVSNSETLNEKVARNAANCLAGHAASNSEYFKAGKTSEYIYLIEGIQGSEAAAETIEGAINKVKSAVRILDSSPKEEGEFLIQKFCPAIDEIINKKA